MKTLGLVLAMVALVGGSCFGATTVMASFNVNPSIYSLIALPCVPLDPAVGGTQSTSKLGDPSGVFGTINTSTNFVLQRWNGGGYDSWTDHASTTPFTSMLLGTGYWLTGTALPSSGVISYAALPDGVPSIDSNGNAIEDSKGNPQMTDMYISLPGQGQGTGGWTIIGHPFDHSTAIDSSGETAGSRIQFTNGQETLGWKAAVSAGWVASAILAWNGGGYTAYGYNGSNTRTLAPGLGYWVQTKVDNLAMIIPAMEDGTEP